MWSCPGSQVLECGQELHGLLVLYTFSVFVLVSHIKSMLSCQLVAWVGSIQLTSLA